jgi:hypothetical protein
MNHPRLYCGGCSSVATDIFKTDEMQSACEPQVYQYAMLFRLSLPF